MHVCFFLSKFGNLPLQICLLLLVVSKLPFQCLLLLLLLGLLVVSSLPFSASFFLWSAAFLSSASFSLCKLVTCCTSVGENKTKAVVSNKALNISLSWQLLSSPMYEPKSPLPHPRKKSLYETLHLVEISPLAMYV